MTTYDAELVAALRAASHQLAVAADALAAQPAPVEPPAAPAKDLLRIHEVAEMTGIAVSTLRNWRQAGTGPKSHRVGSRVVYRESDVQEWLQSQLTSNAG
jgi:excisionase family DNA binding protein